MSKLAVNCPTCSRSIEWSDKSPWRPFCSERCRLIDLGAWFREERGIAGADAPETAPEPEPEDP